MIISTETSNNDLQSRIDTLKNDQLKTLSLSQRISQNIKILALYIVLHDRHNSFYVPVTPS